MKRKHNGGYSLIEVLVAMAVLGTITIPTTSALLTAHRMNVKAEQMLEAQLQVSSAVEELMATGIGSKTVEDMQSEYNGVLKIEAENVNGYYYNVVVASADETLDVSVKTQIRVIH